MSTETNVEGLLARMPQYNLQNLKHGEQAVILAAFADCHSLFPEVTLDLFITRLAAVQQTNAANVSVPVFAEEQLDLHKAAQGLSRIADKTKRNLLGEYVLAAEKMSAAFPGQSFTLGTFLQMTREQAPKQGTLPHTQTETPEGTAPVTTAPVQPAATVPATTTPAAEAPAAEAAKPARRRTAKAPAAAATTAAPVAANTRVQFCRDNGPVLQGHSLGPVSPTQTAFLSDDGEMITAENNELTGSVAPSPDVTQPTIFQTLKIPADQVAYIHSMLAQRTPVSGQALGANLRVLEQPLGGAYVAMLVLTNGESIHIDPYVVVTGKNNEQPVADTAPREYSILGYYEFEIEDQLVRLTVEQA